MTDGGSPETDPWYVRLAIRLAPHDWRLDLVRPHHPAAAITTLTMHRETHASLEDPGAEAEPG